MKIISNYLTKHTKQALCLLCITDESFTQRTDNPLDLSFAFRFTWAVPEFTLRFQALAPDSEDDQTLPFVPRLLNDPEKPLPASYR